MLLTRRSVLHSLIALAAPNENGTSIVIRLSDLRILHIENSGFAERAVLPPASTIKPFAIFALLDSGKLRAGDLFSCSRQLRIKDHILNCVHPRTPLPMNPPRAIAYSCNGAVAHFAQRFAPDEFPQALLRFGLTARRGTSGPDCQLQALGEEGITVTPHQLLLAYAKLAELAQGPVLEGLEGAVEYGTAQAAQVPGVKVAGKTGSIVLRSGSPAAWFAGFAPSRAPKLAVVVLTPGHSGGADAAPIASQLLRRYL